MTKNIETKFAHNGGSVHVVKLDTDQMRSVLAPAVYTAVFNDTTGEFFLETTQQRFKLPATIYGNCETRADKVLRTYHDRSKNTGVLLTGNKGSGKTMLAEIICNRLMDLGTPVVMVSQPFCGPAFNDFITSLGECVIMIDEFTKVYNGREGSGKQDGLLTLMDGIGNTKKLFILTENYTNHINEFLLSRPGRLYYHFEYNKLGEDTIQEYCTARGVAEGITTDIIETSRKCQEFSFDILTTIVEEHLRFDLPIEELLPDLNIEVGTLSVQPLLEVQKLTHKSSNTEMTVKEGDKIIIKPVNRSDYMRVDFYDLYGSTRDQNPDAPVCGSDDDDDDDSDHTYFQLGGIKYESYDKVVYENDEYIIVARPIIQRVPYAF